MGIVRDIVAYDPATDTPIVVNHITYDSFGNLTSETDPGTGAAPAEASIVAGEFLLAFTAREFDAESHLEYNRARYYDPALGQWLSPDPLGFAAGDTNLRRYVENSPTQYTDPSGESVISKGGIIAAKKAAKRYIKKLIKEQIESRIKRMMAQQGLKAKAKQFAAEAAEILDKFDRATSFDPYSFWSWCSEAAEFIPVAGDAYGVIKFGKAIKEARDEIRALEKRMDAAEAAARRAARGTIRGRDAWGRADTLDDHFRRHGGDFGATSADDYAQKAADFFQDAQRRGLPTKVDADGVVRVYDPATNSFGSYNPDGTTRTFFKPRRGIDYWNDQPGAAPWTPRQ